MKLKIAVVQFDVKQYSPKDNLKKAEKFISQASGKADIIVFPEDFVTGPIRLRQDLADSKNKFRDFFQMCAKKYNINIVPGSFIEKDQFGLHNTTYYINHKGKVKARYRKVNLWHPERTYISPGAEVPVFNTRFGKVGLIICWDMMFPEMFRKMVRKGAKIVICPSYWDKNDAGVGLKYNQNAEHHLVNTLCKSRAAENGIVFVYSNAAGMLELPNYRGKLIGQSQITAPFKGVLKKCDHSKEEMFIQEIDMKILDDSERAYKIRMDLKNKVM